MNYYINIINKLAGKPIARLTNRIIGGLINKLIIELINMIIGKLANKLNKIIYYL